jgi:FkbM family methyltransferase
MSIQLLNKQRLLEVIGSYIPKNPVIIEAGAFNGNDTKKLSLYWPKGIIHTFEPVPEIFILLEENTITLPNVRRYQLALSNATGSALFYISEKPSSPHKPFQAGSLHKPNERLIFSDIQYNKTITVPTITIDAWAQKEGIDTIDLLWLDMQGHELEVLKSAMHILTCVKAIYTEVSFGKAYINQSTYEDIKLWLMQQGFVEVGRDFIDQRSWFFGNVLFAKKLLVK